MNGDDREPASPPCGLSATGELPQTNAAAEVDGWRRRERTRLRALRNGIDPVRRKALDARIAAGLERLLDARAPGCVAVYQPLAGEPDLLPWCAQVAEAGTRLALPVVVARDAALEFRAWRPGDALGRDLLGIPAPVNGARVDPDLVVTPCLGFDEAGYRLGNGGGYYDRTLPTLDKRPLLVGVAYRCTGIRSIYPQPHDVPLDFLATEDGLRPDA